MIKTVTYKPSQTFDVSNLSTVELEKQWRQNLSERVPDQLPKSLLSRLLAYRLQVEQQDGLSKKAITYFKLLEMDLRAGRAAETPYPDQQKLKSGCQLLREHNGIDHCVTVLDGGYHWNGTAFTSLSAVAKAITGTNWNGHRFFGLKPKTKVLEKAVS